VHFRRLGLLLQVGSCCQEFSRLQCWRGDDDTVELTKLASLLIAEMPDALIELRRSNLRAQPNVEIRSQMAADGIVSDDADSLREVRGQIPDNFDVRISHSRFCS
jgi:hypothetical protein